MKSDDAELAYRLLGSFVKNEKGEDAQVRAIMDGESPFYEFGKLCGVKYAKKPMLLLKDKEIFNIGKKMVGQYWRMEGEHFYEENNMMKAFVSGKAASGEQLKEIPLKLVSDYLEAVYEFGLGYNSAVVETGCDNVVQAFDFGVEIVNACWRSFGVKFPTFNNYSKRFMTMLDNRDVQGMVDLYALHGSSIDEKLPGAGKLVGFLRAVKE